MKKYKKGKQITSLEELVKQQVIYANDKITHNGWFMSWQISFAKRWLERGWLFYAEKVGGDSDG